jgi:hypothetical protein
MEELEAALLGYQNYGDEIPRHLDTTNNSRSSVRRSQALLPWAKPGGPQDNPSALLTLLHNRRRTLCRTGFSSTTSSSNSHGRMEIWKDNIRINV